METGNWRHIQETINMLYLAICQIEATMTDSNHSVETLTQSFTQLANHTRIVGNHIQELQNIDELQAFKNDMVRTTDEMQHNINASIRAFQFYDRVCQRLDHIAASLEKVTRVIGDEEQRNCEQTWTGVQQEIKNSYSMEAERLMFEFIMRGASVEEALAVYRHHFNERSGSVDRDGDEIELF